MNRVYIKTDIQGRVTAINSDAFLGDSGGWTEIDYGEGDRFYHAQGNYLPKPLITALGICQYKMLSNKVVERTATEISLDVAKMPPPQPSDTERIRALETGIETLKDTVMAQAIKIAAVELKTVPVVEQIPTK